MQDFIPKSYKKIPNRGKIPDLANIIEFFPSQLIFPRRGRYSQLSEYRHSLILAFSSR